MTTTAAAIPTSERITSLRRPLIVLAVLSALTYAFGYMQNHTDVVGGEISMHKVIWLNMSLIGMIVLPAIWLKWGAGMSPAARLVMTIAFAGYAIRGIIELPVMYMTRWWKCEFGMGHDATMTAIVLTLLFVQRKQLQRSDFNAICALLFFCLVCMVEFTYAHMFSSMIDPQTGTYFASNDPKFDRINEITAFRNLWLYYFLGLHLIASRHEFSFVRSSRAGIASRLGGLLPTRREREGQRVTAGGAA